MTDWSKALVGLSEAIETDVVVMCGQWHSGQWSPFYKVSCNGRIVDRDHAEDVASECRMHLKHMKEDHEDYRLMTQLKNQMEYLTEPKHDRPRHRRLADIERKAWGLCQRSWRKSDEVHRHFARKHQIMLNLMTAG